DNNIFRPREKKLQVCVVPRKLPREFEAIIGGLRLLHPTFVGIPILRIDSVPEPQVAAMMASSAVFLSLCHREALPLTPIEAMASGCAIVGYHGWGGLDYANAANGRWFGHDEVEGVIDALAEVLDGLSRQDPAMTAMIARHLMPMTLSYFPKMYRLLRRWNCWKVSRPDVFFFVKIPFITSGPARLTQQLLFGMAPSRLG
ncbi:MAG: glycosyltransferase, partial [Acetobacteraceae bacterium]